MSARTADRIEIREKLLVGVQDLVTSRVISARMSYTPVGSAGSIVRHKVRLPVVASRANSNSRGAPPPRQKWSAHRHSTRSARPVRNRQRAGASRHRANHKALCVPQVEVLRDVREIVALVVILENAEVNAAWRFRCSLERRNRDRPDEKYHEEDGDGAPPTIHRFRGGRSASTVNEHLHDEPSRGTLEARS